MLSSDPTIDCRILITSVIGLSDSEVTGVLVTTGYYYCPQRVSP